LRDRNPRERIPVLRWLTLHNAAVRRRVAIAFPLVAAVVLAAGAGAVPADRAAGASARAFGISITVPGQPSAGTPTLSAPQDAVQFGGAFAYPEDGSILSASSVTLSVSADPGTTATATASTEVTGLRLFNGEVTVDALTAKATSSATPDRASGDTGASGLSNLVVLGQSVGVGANQRIQLADWGYLVVLEQSAAQQTAGTPGFRGFVTALDVHLTADHGGLPAGSSILVGYAEVNTQAAKAPPLPKPPKTQPVVTGEGKPRASKAGPRAPEPGVVPGIPGLVRQPPSVTPNLTAGGYVFPVYGPSSFIDTFGAPRGDVSGGWHHGDDIFAPLGAPLLACATGIVFSVGWNRIGGNRLWIRDEQGNQFYYAHLSAFTPLAKNGNQVNAGDVIGFVGATGDAEGTPYHLHFEIHPVGLLGLGYDGAVNPTSYLLAWKRLEDIPITSSGAFLVAPTPGAHAPKPGAILLQASDISSASGLDPGSLRRAIAPVRAGGDGALARLDAPKR
jgi:murein DD-endopeptidase MepM/ murein hydrolase activator NlpD